MVKCEICGKETISIQGLAVHIRSHKISSKEYYDLYMKSKSDGICKICKKSTKFINLNAGYAKHCSIRCSQLDPVTKNKIKQTNLQKYGCECVFQNDNIKTKIQDSIHKHFGEAGLANKSIINKRYETKLKRYGDANYNNREKVKQTCLKKYGAENVFASEYGKQKIKKTKLDRYGDEWYHNAEKASKTYKETCNKRTKEESKRICEKISQIYKNFSPEKKKRIAAKISQSQKQYYKSLTDEEYNKLCEYRHYVAVNRSKDGIKLAYIKSLETKIKNGTINKSPVEDRFYTKLLTIFSEDDIVRQYYEERYPYACDFYIKSLDLFIEINNHWTHGGHPFNIEIDLETLNTLMHKAEINKNYNNAIYVWTKLDVEKYNIAVSNKLNYMRLYNNDDMNNAIIKLKEMCS